MTDFTRITLGELLSSIDETIKRNSISILKRLQKIDNLTNKEVVMPDKVCEEKNCKANSNNQPLFYNKNNEIFCLKHLIK